VIIAGYMKTFITGASGFIGNNLVRKLTEEGHDISVLIRDPGKAVEFTKQGIKVIQGDIFDNEKLKRGLEGCDWVFHLAAYAKPTSRDSTLPFRTNVTGTSNVLAAAKEAGVKKVVVTSTAGTMGFSMDGNPVDEQTGRISAYHTEYERTKAIMEKIATEKTSESTGIVIVNPTRVFGPGRISISNSVTRIIKLYGMGVWRIIPGDGTSVGNYTFIEDVVNGHLRAAEAGRGGERYILGGENISFNEFFNTIGEVYGKKRRLFALRESRLKQIAGVSAVFSSLFGKPPIISDNWIEKYLRNWILSSNKAITELNYKITPFEEGVEKTVRWLKNGKDHYGQ
jgi:farnesol dehydrogenase